MSSSTLSIESFNEQTTVRIAKFMKHVTPDNIPMANVAFEVRITQNGRIGIFLCDIDRSSFATEDDIVNAAWNEVKQNVNDWCVTNLVNDPFTTFHVSATTNKISVEDFNSNFIVNVVRYDLYPRVNPDWWCIAFMVHQISNPQTSIYVEAQVPTSVWCNNVRCLAVASSAWELVKDRACAWAADHMSKPALLNTLYTPSEI